jgi:hypothetical protein
MAARNAAPMPGDQRVGADFFGAANKRSAINRRWLAVLLPRDLFACFFVDAGRKYSLLRALVAAASAEFNNHLLCRGVTEL